MPAMYKSLCFREKRLPAGDGKVVKRAHEWGKEMNQIKESAIKMIQSLPDDCSWEDIQYHLYVREKVERGMAALADGRVVSQAEAERRIAGRLNHADASPRRD